jgi:F-type H+-transporting ATPase subunit gamma
MATLRQLRDRVKSLKNTQQITRAMKMVAGARIRRAEQAMRAARPYAAALSQMLAELSSASGNVDHPLLRVRAVARQGILLLTADKGLCGAFNANLVRTAQSSARPVPQSAFYIAGLKGHVMLRRLPYDIVAHWPQLGVPFAERAGEIAARISDDFLGGRVDAVTLVSSRFVSTITQRPVAVPLLPVPKNAAGVEAAGPGSAPRGAKNAFEFEPDRAAVLAALLPKYLEFSIFQALLETQASEFAARLLAMTNATDNAGKLIDEITLVMNNTRQASITKEILEIVGGAEALRA